MSSDLFFCSTNFADCLDHDWPNCRETMMRFCAYGYNQNYPPPTPTSPGEVSDALRNFCDQHGGFEHVACVETQFDATHENVIAQTGLCIPQSCLPAEPENQLQALAQNSIEFNCAMQTEAECNINMVNLTCAGESLCFLPFCMQSFERVFFYIS